MSTTTIMPDVCQMFSRSWANMVLLSVVNQDSPQKNIHYDDSEDKYSRGQDLPGIPVWALASSET